MTEITRIEPDENGARRIDAQDKVILAADYYDDLLSTIAVLREGWKVSGEVIQKLGDIHSQDRARRNDLVAEKAELLLELAHERTRRRKAEDALEEAARLYELVEERGDLEDFECYDEDCNAIRSVGATLCPDCLPREVCGGDLI